MSDWIEVGCATLPLLIVLMPGECRLWEKKFGKQANHLKMREKETKKSKRGEALQKPSRRASSPRLDVGWSTAPTRPPATVQVAASTRAESEMHPSWIAKQQQKARAEEALRSGGAAKKIVFD